MIRRKKIIEKKKSKVKVKNLPATEPSPVRKEKIKSIKPIPNSPKTRRPKLDERAPPTLVETGSKGSRKTSSKTSSSLHSPQTGSQADLPTRVKIKESSLVRIMDQMTSGQGSEKGCHGSIIPELEKETSISFENVRSVNCEFKNHE